MLVLYVYSAILILLSLVTRDVQPNKGLLLLGASAFVLAMIPFAFRKRTKA